jgi:hypothetical protein
MIHKRFITLVSYVRLVPNGGINDMSNGVFKALLNAIGKGFSRALRQRFLLQKGEHA